MDEQGNYTVLDSAYSRRLENHFSNQEIELNFRSVRDKYDYTVGFTVQPSTSRSKHSLEQIRFMTPAKRGKLRSHGTIQLVGPHGASGAIMEIQTSLRSRSWSSTSQIHWTYNMVTPS